MHLERLGRYKDLLTYLANIALVLVLLVDIIIMLFADLAFKRRFRFVHYLLQFTTVSSAACASGLHFDLLRLRYKLFRQWPRFRLHFVYLYY